MPLAHLSEAEKVNVTTLDRFRVPIGGQEIELQQLDYANGGISLLRLRIREGKRFTIFDIDPVTARHWSNSLRRWADAGPVKPVVAETD